MYKDAIKETLFDNLGWQDKARLQKLGAASSEVLWLFAEANLAASRPVIFESNFAPKLTVPRIPDLRSRYELELIQIQCNARPDILEDRIGQRIASGERHPGHVDDGSESKASRHQYVSEIGGPVLHLNTSDLERLNYQAVIDEVKSLIGPN